MTEEQAEAQEAEVQETDDSDDEPSADPSVEAEARKTGWRPRSEFATDSDDWVPADKWVKSARHEIRSLRDEIRSIKADHSKEIARIGSMNERALTVQRQQIERDFAEAKRKAVEMGDTKAYDQADRGEKQALKQFDDEAARTAEQANGADYSDEDMATIQTFWQANARMAWSPLLRGAADEIWNEINADEPNLSLKEKLAAVKQRVVDQFPDRFPDQARKGNGAARVEGAGGRSPDGGGEVGGQLWSKVPKDARQIAQQHIEVERLYDPPGAKKGEPLTPAQKKQAQEKWAEQYLA